MFLCREGLSFLSLEVDHAEAIPGSLGIRCPPDFHLGVQTPYLVLAPIAVFPIPSTRSRRRLEEIKK